MLSRSFPPRLVAVACAALFLAALGFDPHGWPVSIRAETPRAASAASPSPERVATEVLLTAAAQAPLAVAEPIRVSAEAKARTARPPEAASKRTNLRVLLIGDSLTVGAFGESMVDFFEQRYRGERWGFAVFGCCGSSPEHWLVREPVFPAKCGYRELSPERGAHLIDFENGHRPPPISTPKIELLLAHYQPAAVVVQLGTNWMDELEGKLTDAAREKHAEILDRFGRALRDGAPGRKLVWVTPPDSSKFSKKTQRFIEVLIRATARKYDIDLIVSSEMTNYVPGRSGGDGVHYKKEEALVWAAKVQRELRKKL